MKQFTRQKGFTLIELLIVIGIIAIFSAIIMPFLSGARESSRIAAGKESDANIKHGIGDQLIGEWLFNEGSGTANDSSGFGNNGTLYGSPSWNATAGFDGKGAYYFNGSSYIYASSFKGLSSTNNITFTAWVKGVGGTGGAPGAGIAYFRGGAIAHTGMSMYGSQLRASWDNGNSWSYNTGLNMSTNSWNFIAMSVAPMQMILYVNGNEYRYTPGTFGVSSFTPEDFSSATFETGYDYGNYFTGYIDNVRVYTASLATSELDRLYAEGLPSHNNLAVK